MDGRSAARMLALAAAAAGLSLPGAAAAAKGRTVADLKGRPVIEVLSDRADLISAGNALVAIDLPAGTRPSQVHVTLKHHHRVRNVTKQFATRVNGRFEALLHGIPLGRSHLYARGPGGWTRALIVDHPNGGPIFSGPQMQPWVCQNGSKDPQCNEPPTYSYQYMSSTDHTLHPYDPQSPPSDVASTTTDQGVTVPFIIRTETGYEDRDQYAITVLYQPGKRWKAWNPQPQFDHKLLITHGASCGIDHTSGTAPSTTSDLAGVNGVSFSDSPTTALGRGFAVMSTALDNAGHNCNLVTEAESLVMAKEHLIERYGTLRYTIGTGCSGGSLVQQQVADAYPGIYQGILPQCSFPDAWSTGQQLADYHLTRLYLEHPDRWAPGVVWTPASIAAVDGHPNHLNSIILDSLYFTALGVPTNPCAGVSDKQRYDPQTNPAGVRCTLADDMINVFGPRPESVWTKQERELGHGFAGRPLDNVGVQYGLDALESGAISPAQFVDLNAKVGGADIDANWEPQRVAADEPALARAYRSGAINQGNNMDEVAIIDLRGPDAGTFHDAYRSFAIRARLERDQGHFPRNDVIWFGQEPLIGDTSYTTRGLLAMDRWLSAVEADHRAEPLAQKLAEDRPAGVHDRCSQIDGLEKVSLPGVGPVCELPLVQTRFGTPRTVAGESVATDSNKCRLKPLRREDYYPVRFTDAQWAELEQAFPTGVCDFSRPGVDQSRTIPWLSYQHRDGTVRYGGRRLGPAPGGSGTGWSSPSFSSWRAAQVDGTGAGTEAGAR